MLIYLITDKYNHTFIILYDPIYNHHQIKIWSIYKYVFISYLLYYLIYFRVIEYIFFTKDLARHFYNHYFLFFFTLISKN